MKKFIISIFLFIILLVPATSFASAKYISKSQDWKLIEDTNDFTDKVGAALVTANNLKFGHPGINMFCSKSGARLVFHVNGKIKGNKITYRVDKNPSVTLTPSCYGGEYILYGKDFETLIEDFKNGLTVIYKVHSDNMFIEDNQERVSLVGFTRLWNKFIEYGKHGRRINND